MNKFDKEIANYVRKFNAKLTRVQKIKPYAIFYLPKRIDVNVARDAIKTKKDLSNFKKDIDLFIADKELKIKSSDYGVMKTEWEINKIQRQVDRINAQRKKELKRMNISKYRGNVQLIERSNLRPKIFDFSKMTTENIDKFIETVNYQSRSDYLTKKQEQYKENYLKSIENEFGINNELYRYVQGLSPEDIYNKYFDSPYLEIGYIYNHGENYDHTENENVIAMSLILSEWKNIT